MLSPAALRLRPSPSACARSGSSKLAFRKRLAPPAANGQRSQNPGEYGGQRAIEVLREIAGLRNLPAADIYSRRACIAAPNARAAGSAGFIGRMASRWRRNCRGGPASSPLAAKYRPSCSGINNQAPAPTPERRGKWQAVYRGSASRRSRARTARLLAPERRAGLWSTPFHLQPRRAGLQVPAAAVTVSHAAAAKAKSPGNKSPASARKTSRCRTARSSASPARW